MKKIYTLLALALISGSVAAQTKDGLKFGIRAGVNLAGFAYSGSDYDSPGGKLIKDNQKSFTSFIFGGYAEIPVSEIFSVQPGLSISGKGGRTEFTQSGPSGTANFKSKMSLMYLELPVNAVFNFSGFYLGAGPYLGYGIAGKASYETKINGVVNTMLTEPERDVEFGSGEDDDIKPLDFGANILAGYKLESGLNFGVNYGLGLTNLNPENSSNNKASNRVFSILVGFSF